MTKIITINTQGNEKKEKLYKFLDNIIQNRTYDFVLLQEVSSALNEYLQPKTSHYQLLNIEKNTPYQKTSLNHLVIIYKRTYNLEDSYKLKFARKKSRLYPVHGCLVGIFAKKNQAKITIANIHLHCKLFLLKRFISLKKTNKLLKKIDKKLNQNLIIMGGDFNSPDLESKLIHDRIFNNFLVRYSNQDLPTYDSKYVEKTSFVNRLFAKLGEKNIGLKFNLDKYYLSNNTDTLYQIKIKPIPIVISDHLPVALQLDKKK